MRYFVVYPNGQRYGPADLPTLNQWAAEGRIMGMMTLEEEGSGQRIVASQMPGLNLPGQPHLGNYSTGYGTPYAGPPPGPGGYPTGYSFQPQVDTGRTDLSTSYAFSAIGLALGLCNPFLVLIAIGGIVFANYAGQKGHRGATSARIFAVLAMAIAVAVHFFAANWARLL